MARSNGALVQTLTTLRVLVVDDDRDCADSMAELLQCWGCTVRIAYQGEDGVAAAATFQPDVILLDLAMPRLSGYDCARAVFAQAGRWDTAVFAVTGYGDEHHRAQAMFAGFDEYLVKPVDPQELERLLRLELSFKAKPKDGVASQVGSLAKESVTLQASPTSP